MKHYLHAQVLERNPRVSISSTEFSALKLARESLAAAFALEEIYDLVVGNFRELEISVISSSVAEMTRWKEGYGDHFTARSEFNRRTLNLLSAARLYLDQYQGLLRQLGGSTDTTEERRRSVYETSFEYRFMEALRNHVQHAGRAVHGVETSRSWQPPEHPRQLEYRTVPYAMKSSLLPDGKFKKTVLLECPEKVAITPAARAYVGGLSVIHQQVRLVSDPLVKKHRGLLEAAIEKHKKRSRKRFVGLAAVAVQDNGSDDVVPVLLEWDDVRARLARQNRPLTNLDQRYVSSRTNDA